MLDTIIFDLTQIQYFAVYDSSRGIFHYVNNCYFYITNNPRNAVYWQYCFSSE